MKRAFSAVLSAVALAIPLTVASPASATPSTAEACETMAASDVDPGSAYSASGQQNPVRSGPYAECDPKLYLGGGTKVALWCRAYNNLGNLWYFVREPSTGVSGWVYSNNLTSFSGSNGAWC